MKSCNKVNADVPEYSRYQDMVEGRKINKDLTALPRYVSDNILKVQKRKEDKTVDKILEC